MAKITKRQAAFLEILAFYSVALFLIWGSNIWRPPVLLAAVVMIGICIQSNRYHQDSLERIGLARKNFWPTMKLSLMVTIPFMLPLVYFAWGKEVRMGWDLWFSFLGYPFWGFAQEYALLGFVGNRLEDLFGGKKTWVPWVNGTLFGLAHLPNPVLTPLTFISGVVFTWIFLQRRHLIPLALIHAVFGVLISLALADKPGLMSVGQAYLSRVAGQ